GDLDAVAVAGQRLVDRVVDDLPDQVMQAALRGGADVHTGALADRLQSFQDRDGLAGVFVLGGGAACHRHGPLPDGTFRMFQTRTWGGRAFWDARCDISGSEDPPTP